MRIYYFGELIADTNKEQRTTNGESAVHSENRRKPYKRPQVRPIREVLDEEPDFDGRQLLAFRGTKKFIIRDFAHA